MSFTRIITIILGLFILALVATSYLSIDKDNLAIDTNKIDPSFDNVKDSNLFSKPLDTYDSLKSRVKYGSFDRNLPMEVYFCPEDNCLDVLLENISSSKKTIDCAVYDLSLDTVTDALISKADQGLNVRFVSDYQRSEGRYSNIGKLKDSNVSVITNPTESSYMHNKFCVFDQKTVLVGSMNFTLNGNYKNNNNVLVIEDKELAREYTKKIDSFFQGEFSLETLDNVSEKFYGNVENYFCPEDNCLYHLIDIIEDVNYSLDCMFFSFTLDDFFDIVKDKDISQKYILEKRNINSYSQYNNLKNNNIPVILDQNPNSMHNKFCIIDDSIVFTGSMNISKNGTENNDESFVIVYDREVALEYKNYFYKYWNLWQIN
jgi:hypothetical protein